MEEWIKKSDAIEAIKDNSFALGDDYLEINGYGAIDDIRALPSADRPQGEWIDKGKNLWKCSNCEMVIYSESEQDRNEFHKWCSRCGARMKGEGDDMH